MILLGRELYSIQRSGIRHPQDSVSNEALESHTGRSRKPYKYFTGRKMLDLIKMAFDCAAVNVENVSFRMVIIFISHRSWGLTLPNAIIFNSPSVRRSLSASYFLSLLDRFFSTPLCRIADSMRNPSAHHPNPGFVSGKYSFRMTQSR